MISEDFEHLLSSDVEASNSGECEDDDDDSAQDDIDTGVWRTRLRSYILTIF